MNSHRLFSCSYVLFLTSILSLATGCPSVSSNSNPTPTPTPGTTPSPTPVPTPSPTPTPAPSNATITGKVLDPSGAPVAGMVIVSLEQGPGDFRIVKQTNADANGNFRFDNVAAVPIRNEGYCLVLAPRHAPAASFTPAHPVH